MKKNIITCLVPLTLALSSCAELESSLAQAAAESASAAETSAYDRGLQRGFVDGQGGSSRTPSRHYNAAYSAAEVAAFEKGYEVGYSRGIKPGATAPETNAPYGKPLTAVNGQGSVVIKEGSRTVSVCKTASPNIEQTRFINEQSQIVVKSRGNHGPATVQLFDARSGREQSRAMAFEIKGGQPAWARGMGE